MSKFKMGARVKIYNQKMSGKKFMEGIAIVGKRADGGNYHVRFVSDGYLCERNLSEAELVE